MIYSEAAFNGAHVAHIAARQEVERLRRIREETALAIEARKKQERARKAAARRPLRFYHTVPGVRPSRFAYV